MKVSPESAPSPWGVSEPPQAVRVSVSARPAVSRRLRLRVMCSLSKRTDLQTARTQESLRDAREVVDRQREYSGQRRTHELDGETVGGQPRHDDVPQATRVDISDESGGADVDHECGAHPSEDHWDGEGQFELAQNRPAAHSHTLPGFEDAWVHL